MPTSIILSSTGWVQSIVNFRDTFFFCPLPRRTCFLAGPLAFFAVWKFVDKILLTTIIVAQNTCKIIQRGRYKNLTRSNQSQDKTKIRHKPIDKLNTLFLSPILFRGNSVIIMNNRCIFARARTYRSHVAYGWRMKEPVVKELTTEWYGATIVYARTVHVRACLWCVYVYIRFRNWYVTKCKLLQKYLYLHENNCFLFGVIKIT